MFILILITTCKIVEVSSAFSASLDLEYKALARDNWELGYNADGKVGNAWTYKPLLALR